MRILVRDRLGYSLSSSARKFTDEGYLIAPAHVARTGIQQYLASELELTDRGPNEIVNVYRPPEEVFSAASLASYQHKELTDNHPPEMVSAQTYKEYSVGQVASAGIQDGEFVKIDLIAKDAEAIAKISAGKAQLSAGYYADYDQVSGKTEDGTEYEFIQRNIVINHVALVDMARAGQGAKIFDHDKGGKKMPVKISLDNGRHVEVDDAVAPLVEDSISRLTKQVADANTALAAKDAELEKEKAKADNAEEELEKEKEKTSDAAIEKMVNDRLAVIDSARKLVKDIDCTGKTVDAIKREVVTALHPNRDFKDRDMTYINAVFDMDKEEKEKAEDEDEEEKTKANDSHMALANDLSGKNKSTVTDARAVLRQRTSDAWKLGA